MGGKLRGMLSSVSAPLEVQVQMPITSASTSPPAVQCKIHWRLPAAIRNFELMGSSTDCVGMASAWHGPGTVWVWVGMGQHMDWLQEACYGPASRRPAASSVPIRVAVPRGLCLAWLLVRPLPIVKSACRREGRRGSTCTEQSLQNPSPPCSLAPGSYFFIQLPQQLALWIGGSDP